MILRIIGILIACTALIFIAYWIWSGGLSRAIRFASNYQNPFTFLSSTSTAGAIRLPGQPDSLIDTIDVSANSDSSAAEDSAPPSARDQLNALQNRYEELSAQAKDPKSFGNPSPHRNQVTFGLHNAQQSSPAAEYLILQANFSNTAPISLAGWSLQSAVSGVRIMIPAAAPEFVSGILNTVSMISLSPGGSAYVVSGPSPVGVSFRENVCSGYLGERQTFTPELERQCPLASEELSLNAQNIANFGDTCVDYTRVLPQCHFPGLDAKPNVTDACANFLLNRLSYNGCMMAHRNDRDFYTSSWRVYLASGVNLWRDTHDVIRLLDEDGRTVDVLTY